MTTKQDNTKYNNTMALHHTMNATMHRKERATTFVSNRRLTIIQQNAALITTMVVSNTILIVIQCYNSNKTQ